MKLRLLTALVGAAVFGTTLTTSTSALGAKPVDAPYINTWLLAGPYPLSAPDGGLAASPREGDAIGGKAWSYFDDRLFCRNLDDYQDLYSYFKVKQGLDAADKTALAHVYVYSPTSMSANLALGGNDRYDAWVNGAYVGGTAKAWPARRDAASHPIQLSAGWNRLLLSIANTEHAWGFYARIKGTDGGIVPGLQYSVNGPGAALAVTTKALDFTPNAMPLGFMEWPYCSIALTQGNVDTAAASKFRFNAEGGRPPYKWSVTGGALPDGLALNSDVGELEGICASIGRYSFTVTVTDAEGHTADKSLDIEVKDRPNHWLEREKLYGLWHSPQLALETTEAYELESYLTLLKSMGYAFIMPTTNGATTDYATSPGVWGVLSKAAAQAGLGFGIYVDPRDDMEVSGSVNQLFPRVESLQTNFRPVMYFIDLDVRKAPSMGMQFDALFSLIKSYNPDALILVNGQGITGVADNQAEADTFNRGDIDVLSAEGWAGGRSPKNGGWYWDRWPVKSFLKKNPKKLTYESWRYPNPDPSGTFPGLDNMDSTMWLKSMFTLLGEGLTVDLDVSNFSGDAQARKVRMFEEMAAWLNPKGVPSLLEAFKATQPVTLDDMPWGYAVGSTDAIYLYIMENFKKKTGRPASGELTIGPVSRQVREVTVMNTGQSVGFSQSGDRVTLNMQSIVADKAVTVVNIRLL